MSLVVRQPWQVDLLHRLQVEMQPEQLPSPQAEHRLMHSEQKSFSHEAQK
jgi:hypothetical protein